MAADYVRHLLQLPVTISGQSNKHEATRSIMTALPTSVRVLMRKAVMTLLHKAPHCPNHRLTLHHPSASWC